MAIQCKSNLRQIGLAEFSYEHDYSSLAYDAVSYSNALLTVHLWTYKTFAKQYLNVNDKRKSVYFCPGDTDTAARLNNDTASSYARAAQQFTNDNTNDYVKYPKTAIRTEWSRQPSQTIFLQEATRSWAAYANSVSYAQNYRAYHDTVIKRDVSILFIDGHVSGRTERPGEIAWKDNPGYKVHFGLFHRK